MKLVCTMPVRNEAWILGLTARAVLMWCDGLVLLDHCSTDGTHQICRDVMAEYPGRVSVILKPHPVWEEMAHRQSMLEKARERGVTHIVCVDADEILTGNLLTNDSLVFQHVIRRQVWAMRDHVTMQLPWIQLRGSIHRMHNTGTWADQQVSVAFQDSPELHWAARDGYDFHHRHPMGRECVPYKPLQRSQGGLMHLQMVSDRRLRAKQYLYCLTERLRWPNREPIEDMVRKYSLAVYGDPQRAANGVPNWAPQNARSGEGPVNVEPFAEVPAAWWAGYEHLMQYLDVDAEPWQFAECQRIIRENPGIEAGLDMFDLDLSSSSAQQ